MMKRKKKRWWILNRAFFEKSKCDEESRKSREGKIIRVDHI
jgi:hypothetical protein